MINLIHHADESRTMTMSSPVLHHNLVLRIAEGYVIIERDQNDKLVVDALVQAGIPRDKVILAYAGEPVPETC